MHTTDPDAPGLRLDPALGDRLDLAAYRADFRDRQWTIDGQDSWKLERRQHFQEPGFPSWDAFARGDWHEALRLIEAERDYLHDFGRENTRRRTTLLRVRVVEQPLTPYLQWELHLLRLRAECGEHIRVVGPEAVRDREGAGPLPERVTLGAGTVYQVLYTEQGALDGAVRFTDPEVTARCREFVRELYEAGEDLVRYVDREVAHLPPPLAE
ncbi:DUF6879 family protein [Streptomyces sp. NPDC092296]|uniref:DUF6879 family protein n=1 Tax=Streptomyces sp. NPDC092296 TaxID=3366012 RepID=UPI003828D308